MRAVIQRVKKASVSIDEKEVSRIDQGLLIFLGVTHEDTQEDAIYLAKKILNLRIFEDAHQKMNLSALELNLEILSVSQFTLYADTKRGNRPSFTQSAHPTLANDLYEHFNKSLKLSNIIVKTGVFGAMMTIDITNDGPVTIIIDSHNRKLEAVK